MTRTLPPSPTELFQRYLREQTAAAADGLGPVEDTGEVQLHDAGAAQPVDPKQAWEDARAVLAHFPELAASDCPPPPDWPALVAGQASAVALPFCLGNSPQFVRSIQPLLSGPLTAPTGATGMATGSNVARNESPKSKDYPQALMMAAADRLAGNFDRAAETLAGAPPVEWQAAHANESAALLWHQGQAREAAERWHAMPGSVPAWFNRGLAALVLGDFEAGRLHLGRAVAALPEASPWHHLGRIYLAITAENA